MIASPAPLRLTVCLSAAAALAALGLFLATPGCGSSHTGAGPGSPDTGVDVVEDDAEGGLLMPPPITRTQTEGQLAPQRQACAFDAGAWAAQTLGTEDPVGTDIPINHVVVIMQENRSFDHYLGRLAAQGYYKAGDFTSGDAGAGDGGAGEGGPGDGAAPGSGFAHSDEIDVPPPGWSNPDIDGGVVVPHPDNEYCYGVDHSWQGQHNNYDNGKNDGFVITNSQDDVAAGQHPDGQRAMFYEDDTVIPFYYALASTFSVGDQYHCSVLGPTWPNRLFMMAATSFGIGDNSFVTMDTQTSPVSHIFHLLDEAGRTWADYTDSLHQVQFFSYYGIVRRATLPHLKNVKCDLFADIKAGALPDVSFIMGDEIDEFSDEGPSDLPGIGAGLIESIVRAVFASPNWKDTAIFIVYDENGGLADHVPAVPACIPDGYMPHDGNNVALPGKFDTTGFRVPFILVSPYARAHYVSHTVHDHTSITRFIEARFGLPALTARDANSTPPYEMFDFAHPAFTAPPSITAHTTVPPATLTQCKQTLPPTCTQ
jgi:phospholipase C